MVSGYKITHLLITQCFLNYMRFAFLTLAFVSITVFSCQPGVDDILPPVETNDSIYISRIVELDTLFPSGLDTSQHTTYKYDGSGRLSYAWFGEYFIGKAGAELTDDYYYFYNGSDSLPFKVVNISGSTGYSAGFTIYRYDTVFLFYNNAGVVVKDSLRSAGPDQVHDRTQVSTYTKINDALYRIDEKTITENDVTVSFTNCHLARVNGNLVSSKDTTYNQNGINITSSELSVYDNHPNPLLRTALPYPTSRSHYNVFGESSINNLTRWQSRYDYGPSVGYDYLNIYEYKYRADGYPVIRFTKDQVEPSIIRKYIYTKL